MSRDRAFNCPLGPFAARHWSPMLAHQDARSRRQMRVRVPLIVRICWLAFRICAQGFPVLCWTFPVQALVRCLILSIRFVLHQRIFPPRSTNADEMPLLGQWDSYPPSDVPARGRARKTAPMRSRFMRAMKSGDTSLGQTEAHSRKLVQPPKPSASMVCLILSNRFVLRQRTFPPRFAIDDGVPLLGQWGIPRCSWMVLWGPSYTQGIVSPIASRPKTPCSVHPVFVAPLSLGWRRAGRV
jgi:hypothetical protein